MNPDERDQLIQRYYDGETIGNEKAQAQALLESDPGARAALEQLQTLSDEIRIEISEAVADEDFSTYWSRIQSRLPTGPPTGEIEVLRDEDLDPGRVEAAVGPEVVVRSPQAMGAPRRSWWPWVLGPALGAAAAAALVFAIGLPGERSGADGGEQVAEGGGGLGSVEAGQVRANRGRWLPACGR